MMQQPLGILLPRMQQFGRLALKKFGDGSHDNVEHLACLLEGGVNGYVDEMIERKYME